MTKILARLEDRGLLQRTPHPTDGRQVLLSPTADGQDVVAEQRRVKDEWLTRVLTGLTPAERQILRQAAEIMARIAREGD
jgi:DNA-binding MarR family transcriptional regulator